MEWDQITEKWASMALRLRNDKFAPPQNIAGVQDLSLAPEHQGSERQGAGKSAALPFDTTTPAAIGTDRIVRSNP